MKIIDLLNKIANGEEVPKKFKYEDLIITRDKAGNYIDDDGDMFTDSILTDFSNLIDEVEIIEEEKKIPEKITINENGTIGFPNGQWIARNMDKAFAMKINSIIDYLKSKGE